jgi:hypothetical protein
MAPQVGVVDRANRSPPRLTIPSRRTIYQGLCRAHNERVVDDHSSDRPSVSKLQCPIQDIFVTSGIDDTGAMEQVIGLLDVVRTRDDFSVACQGCVLDDWTDSEPFRVTGRGVG